MEKLLGKKISPILPTLTATYAGAPVFMVGIDASTTPKLGYDYFLNWTIATELLMLIPAAVIMSVLFTVLVSSRINNARGATQVGTLIVVPLGILYVAGEIDIINLDVNTLLLVAGILSEVDVVLFFVSAATFQQEEILTKWK